MEKYESAAKDELNIMIEKLKERSENNRSEMEKIRDQIGYHRIMINNFENSFNTLKSCEDCWDSLEK